jgi:hypothetical protein
MIKNVTISPRLFGNTRAADQYFPNFKNQLLLILYVNDQERRLERFIPVKLNGFSQNDRK